MFFREIVAEFVSSCLIPFFLGPIGCAWLIFKSLEENIPSKLQEVGQMSQLKKQNVKTLGRHVLLEILLMAEILHHLGCMKPYK